MLQELSHMDRITQLQNEIEQVRRRSPSHIPIALTGLFDSF